MILKYGITSFFDSSKREVPFLDFKEFKKLTYLIAKRINSKVEKIEKNSGSHNYYYALFSEKPHKGLVCNAHYPLVAFVKSFHEPCFGKILISAEDSFISNIISDSYYFEYISSSILETEFKEEMAYELGDVELEQIKYWNSKTLGEIIFNYYD